MTVELHKDGTGAYRQRLRIDEHTLFADVTRELGGDGSAPDPHDLFDASLAACKAITVMMVARRRKVPLESIDVIIERDSSEEQRGHYRLAVSLHFNGDLDDDARQKLLEIADKCPVHKLMTQTEIHIDTRLG